MRHQRALAAAAKLAGVPRPTWEGATLAPGAGRMRAWRLHAYGALPELRLQEARVPALRAPHDVLVRVRAASLNPIDVAMIGEAPPIARAGVALRARSHDRRGLQAGTARVRSTCCGPSRARRAWSSR